MTSASTAPTRRALPALLAALALAGCTLAALTTLAAVRYAGVTCAEDAVHRPWSGQRALLGVVLAALLPWVLAASRTAPHTRTRIRLLVCATVTAAPPVLALLVGLDHAFWRAGLC